MRSSGAAACDYLNPGDGDTVFAAALAPRVAQRIIARFCAFPGEHLARNPVSAAAVFRYGVGFR
jgi:hypothetical protein